MDKGQKKLKTIVVATLASLGLVAQSFAQTYNNPQIGQTREIEHSRLNTAIPQSFNYKGKSFPLNNTDSSRVSIEYVVPSSFVSDVVVTVQDQVRREQQNSDENIMKRQKVMVEGIKRKK